MSRNEMTDRSYWESQWAERNERSSLQARVKRSLLMPLKTCVSQQRDHTLRILELGCCPGHMLLAIGTEFPKAELYGLDICEEELAATKELLCPSVPRENLFCEDLMSYEPKQKYGCVVSFGLFEHFTDPTACLRKAISFLEPGGVFYLTIPQYSTLVQRVFIGILDPGMWGYHSPLLMNSMQLERTLVQSGLQNVQSGVVGAPLIRTTAKGRGTSIALARTLGRGWNYMISGLCKKPLFDWGTAVWAAGIKQ